MANKMVGKIYSTTDYAQFKYRKDNRKISENNIKAKMKSIQKMGQRQPMHVYDNFEIEDGQNRLEACKRLGIPVDFIFKTDKLSTEELANLQSSSKGWVSNDFMGAYSLDNEDYKLYKLFSDKYPEYSHDCCLIMLANESKSNGNNKVLFKEGKFKVKSWNKAVKSADNIRNLGRYFPHYNKRGFVCAILRISDMEGFEFNRLLRKMPKRASELSDFSQTENYLEALQKIYNWKETKKVYFI